jgi:ribonuclease P protein component
MRQGVRTGRPTLVVHASRVEPSDGAAPAETEVRVGFVVSKAVGNAVTRNRVKRRLRHLAADALATTPPGTHLVVRALPRAATNPSELSNDLDKAWEKALHRLTERHPAVGRRSRP